MLYKVGLDFGMTTSILSYLHNDELKVFYYGGETDGGTPYVPTAVLYEEKDLQIGQFAIEMESEEFQPERYFKMRLSRPTNDKLITTIDIKQGNPAENLTADFLGELIKGTCPTRQRIAHEKLNKLSFVEFLTAGVESLTIAVPYSWEDDKFSGARNRLRKVVSERLTLPVPEFISEPVAAAAFFSHLYRKNNEESFKGNLLVCDMGGGTFDVTLCRVGIDSINPIVQSGTGNADGFGVAGNHFDRTLIGNCFKQQIEPMALSLLLKDLDEQKKKKSKLLEQVLAGDKPKEFSIYVLGYDKKVNVKLQDLKEAFIGIRQSIRDVLQKVLDEARRKNESIDRAIMVGGFARFPLVRQAIQEFLNENDFTANTLLDLNTLTTDQMAYAISYGTCLIANGLIETSEKYHHTISIKVTSADGSDLKLDIVKAGTSRHQLADGVLSADRQGVKMPFQIGQKIFEIEFTVELNGNHPFTKRESFAIPEGFNFENRRFFIGGKVDKYAVPHLILQDEETGESFERSLEKILTE